ncbi:MAG TPA: NAD-dependent epimerase/dehydratase family protein [Acidimicrobiales bacterium]|nr:NAD-dependent epimerase/dehydratase family protein [Acidimicrobiales bacterium]
MVRAAPPRRVAVLGGTGLLGAEIARAYLRLGCEVTVLARHRPQAQRAQWLRAARLVLGPAEDESVVTEALRGADHVVHAVGAPYPAENEDPLGHHIYVMATLAHLLEALRRRPGVGFTFLSSGGAVYGDDCPLPVPEDTACAPVSAYGATKLAAEGFVTLYAARHGVPSRILRVANAYGSPGPDDAGRGVVEQFLAAARTGGTAFVFGDGSAVRDHIAAPDVAHAAVMLSLQPGGPVVVNVGSGVGTSVTEVLETVQSVTGRRLAVEWLAARPGDVTSVYLDTRRLATLTRWEPASLSEGVGATWEAWQRAAPSVAVGTR